MTRNLWAIAVIAFGAVAALSASPAARADDFPTKPVTVVVGYPAGGPTDALMRAIAPRLASEWKQQVIVDNRPGANEAIAAQLVSKASPDGYTVLLSTEAPLTQNQFLYKKLNYNPEKDFAPVTQLVSAPLALVVNPKLPVNSLQEFISLAKSSTGSRSLNYASAGSGGVLHLPMEMLAKQNGLTLNHVPYKGTAPLLTDLIAGQVDLAWVAIASVAPYVQSGKLRALVVDAPERVKALPQTPVFSETGVGHVQADFIFALTAPAHTPPAVTEKIAKSVRKVLADPEFRKESLDPFGYVPVASTPGELADYLAKDRPQQAERVKVSGAKLD